MTDAALAFALADTAQSPLFERFLAGYEQSFTLPDETENRDGFAQCLALNHAPEHGRLAARFGAFQELCVVASDASSGVMVGGANFIAIAPSDTDDRGRDAPITANLNYLYICPQARGRGILRLFLQALHRLIGTMFGGPAARPVAIFIEQNDPFHMSREAYLRDSAHSGMDQFDRLRIWSRMRARVVDFPYVQPPLSASQAADETLVYSVMGVDAPGLPPEILRHHLAAYFGISVLKGAPLEDSPTAMAQLERLNGMIARGDTVPLIDPAPLLAALGDPLALLERRDRPQSLRSALARSIQS